MDHAEWTDHGATRPVARQQFGNHADGLVTRAAIGIDKRTGRSPQSRAPHRIVHQRENRIMQLALAMHLNRSAIGDERVRDLAEVLHVRTKDDRLAVNGRLEDVVSTRRNEAAADENGGGDLIELRQLANRVEDHRIRLRLRIDRQLAAADRGESLVPAQSLDFCEPLGVTRRVWTQARPASMLSTVAAGGETPPTRPEGNR